ncbi:MAG: sialate O-acetylesterase, partial [Rufibacter sp.]
MVLKRLLLLFILLGCQTSAFCHIKLPRLVSDGMVLQRNQPLTLWGWASPGEKVSLTFQKKQYQATTAPDGKWQIKLPAQPAGGPFEFTFKGSNSLTVKDILFGDVWVCGGQSNMELTLDRVRGKYAQILEKANYPQIRQFEVTDKYDFKKPWQDLESGAWRTATPEHLLKFSAVGFFFARDLYTQYKVPIGLINSALGGSPAEAWISEEALKQFPAYYKEAQEFKEDALIAKVEAEDRAKQNQWYAQLSSLDVGLKEKWAKGQQDVTGWQEMQIPGYWASTALGQVNGAVWFRKEITLSKNLAGQPAKLELGRIVDADSVFLNGQFIGTTSYQYPPRRYSIPANLLKEGKNVFMVRIINNSGQGGFVPDKPYELTVGNQKIDLKGTWQFQVGAKMAPTPGQTFVRWKPVGLYNAMIAPLTWYGIKGVIWYQGESNVKNPGEYASL